MKSDFKKPVNRALKNLENLYLITNHNCYNKIEHIKIYLDH